MVTTGSEQSWTQFVDLTRDRPPRELLVEALTHVAGRDAAIDLGAGALNESRLLVREGFRSVIALDSAPVARSIAATLRADRFAYVISAFEEYAFPAAAFDVVNAQFALPFIRPDAFSRVFAAMLASLKPGGVFAGQLFGDRDEWKDDAKMNFHSADAARELFADLAILEFREEEARRPMASGEVKHWHIFHIIARRPGP